MNRHWFLPVAILLMHGNWLSAQSPAIDPLSYGVVLDHAAMKNVKEKLDVTYLKDSKGSLNLDIYSPPGLKAGDKRPAIIFLNAIGERPGSKKVKSWGIYTSWPKLMAAHGYIGISMETDGARIQESIQGVFSFLADNGNSYHIDAEKLGVYAASANVTQSLVYLMGEKAFRGIKAAVLYYGNARGGPYRKDLPVLFVVAEGDAGGTGYNNLWTDVLKNKAPWTIKMASGLPHAFDAFSDNDEARKVVKETISFWQNHLDPVKPPSWSYSKGRDILGSMQLDHAKAIKLLKSLADENPNDVSTLTYYGTELRHSKQWNEAESVFKKIIALDPKNVGVLISLASVAYSQNKNTEAESYVSAAISSGAMERIHYSDLGYNLLVVNKNREAAVYYEKALAMGSRNVDYYNLACAYAKDNNKDKAFVALDQSIKSGYGSKQQIESDSDFDSIRSDERYKALLEKIK